MERAVLWRDAVGKSVSHLDTPVALVDLDAVDRNNAAMAKLCRDAGVTWRAHAKMHKSSRFARDQVAAGAVGVCVQKTGEAEAMAAGGVRDIYISNEVISEAKLQRVAALAARVRLAIAVDSALGLERLSAALRAQGNGVSIRVLVDIDVGHGRCGCTLPVALSLARAIVADAHMQWGGIHCYHGAIQHLRSRDERERAATAVAVKAGAARDALIEAVGSCPTVTGGGTGTFPTDLKHVGIWTELQPGSYVFGDVDYGLNEWSQGWPWERAFFVRAQVVSRSDTHAVIDAGNKSHSLDAKVEPRVRDHVEWNWFNGGDEHGILRGAAPLPALGECVTLIPGHIDPTVAMWDHVVGYRGDTVQEIIAIDARSRAD